MTRPMTFTALRFAVAEADAQRAMRAEAEQAERDAERVRDLLRMRCTVRLERWGKADREILRQHRELQRSLRALQRDVRAR